MLASVIIFIILSTVRCLNLFEWLCIYMFFIEFYHALLHNIFISYLINFCLPYTMFYPSCGGPKTGPSYESLPLHSYNHSHQIWSAPLKSVFNETTLLKPWFCSLTVTSLSLNPGLMFLFMDSISLPPLWWQLCTIQPPGHQWTHHILFFSCAFLLK